MIKLKKPPTVALLVNITLNYQWLVLTLAVMKPL